MFWICVPCRGCHRMYLSAVCACTRLCSMCMFGVEHTTLTMRFSILTSFSTHTHTHIHTYRIQSSDGFHCVQLNVRACTFCDSCRVLMRSRSALCDSLAVPAQTYGVWVSCRNAERNYCVLNWVPNLAGLMSRVVRVYGFTGRVCRCSWKFNFNAKQSSACIITSMRRETESCWC